MQMKTIFAVKDNKVGTYGNPFFCDHEVIAIREATIAVNDIKTQLNKYPQDFDLYRLGQWENSGKITSQDPVFILSLASLLEKETNDVRENGQESNFSTQTSL